MGLNDLTYQNFQLHQDLWDFHMQPFANEMNRLASRCDFSCITFFRLSYADKVNGGTSVYFKLKGAS